MGRADSQQQGNGAAANPPPAPAPPIPAPPAAALPHFSSSLPKRKFGLVEAYLFWMPFGILGAHHFYLGRFRMGFLYLMSVGGGGIGWLIDACRMPYLVKTAEEEWSVPEGRRIPKVLDAYICWFPPLGLLGNSRPKFTLVALMPSL